MPNGIVAYADLEDDGVEATLDRHLAASSLVRGVRIREHPADPTSETFVRSLAGARNPRSVLRRERASRSGSCLRGPRRWRSRTSR